MILWTIKLISSVRRTIAGRKHPSQLAWGVALGALVGLIPHGNLLAIMLVLLALTLRVNHAIVALVGVGISLVAPRLDPTFDSVGRWFFEQPWGANAMAAAWQYPLVPWTDLNNTIVMGSFLIGLIALLPLYLLTNPLFRAWANTSEDAERIVTVKSPKANAQSEASQEESRDEPLHRADTEHAAVARPHVVDPNPPSAPVPVQADLSDAPAMATSERVYDVRRVDVGPAEVKHPKPAHSPRKTRISMGPAPASTPAKAGIAATASGETTDDHTDHLAPAAASENKLNRGIDLDQSCADDQHKIDEALSYLLRQLRDSQDKDAA